MAGSHPRAKCPSLSPMAALPGAKGWPEAHSWDVAGAAGGRRRLGPAGVSLQLCSKWRHPTSRRPGWESGARGTAGEQRLAFIPFTSSPSLLPPCPGLFVCFLCFSCLLGHPAADARTKSEPSAEAVPVPPAPQAPLRPQEHSGGIEPGWESSRACPAVGLGASGASLHLPGILLLQDFGAGGFWACRSCPRFDRTSFGGANVSQRRPV